MRSQEEPVGGLNSFAGTAREEEDDANVKMIDIIS
jgi:molybdopterin synthase catalytic subunit